MSAHSFGPLEVVLPTLPHLRAMVEEMSSSWTVPVRIVEDVESRRYAFRQARAALVKSGTVTLELALAGVPMVAAYQVALIEEAIAHVQVNARQPSSPILFWVRTSCRNSCNDAAIRSSYPQRF